MGKYIVLAFIIGNIFLFSACAKYADHPFEPPRSEKFDNRETNEDIYFLAFDRDGWEVPLKKGTLLSDEIVKSISDSQKPVYLHIYSHGWQYDYIEAKKEFNKLIKLSQADHKQANLQRYKFIGIYLHWPSASRFAASFLYMKDRAQLVGSTGGHALLLKLQKALEKNSRSRIVLIGHSLGAKVVCDMLVGPIGEQTAVRPVDGLIIIQGAISLWSFCARIPDPEKEIPLQEDIGPGRYWQIIRDGLVKGPIVVTYSASDSVLRSWFELGTQDRGELPFDFRPDDYRQGPNQKTNLPAFGAIGGHGAQGPMPRVTKSEMKNVKESYHFRNGWLYNVDASIFIKDHMKFLTPQTMWIIMDLANSNISSTD